MKIQSIIMLIFGFILGCIAVTSYITIRETTPVITCIGKVKLDTASYEDIPLNNATFMENPGVPSGRLYMRFTNSKTMSHTIGKFVKVNGRIKSVILKNGDLINEMIVINLELIDKNSQPKKHSSCFNL
ncbi:hypothetical protein IJ00_00565 [Calothrix sp. 336/3]|nr:hypothetical protein IJ00_00565 [Calothrix sp. 336/3]